MRPLTRTVLMIVVSAALPVIPACDAGPGGGPGATRDAPPPEGLPVRDTALESRLRAIAEGIEGQVGVAVLHLQDGTWARVNGDRPFPLASVYKLPIAYAALVDGAVRPGDTVRIEARDAAPGTTPLAAGSTATVARLVERSLARSDNTASDALLRIAGGPDAVNARLADLGITDVRVDRPMSRVFADGVGTELDTGTARGIAALLDAVHQGVRLTDDGRALLLEALQAADTGPGRIRAGVPAGTVVAHKTGTLGTLSHDAGIMTLPHGGVAVAIAVLVDSPAPAPERERVIAELARAAWERFNR